MTERHLSESSYFYFVPSPAVPVARALTHTLVLLHSKCVSHGVTQLGRRAPSLLRLPFSSPLSIFRQKDVEGRREKQSSDSVDCCATVVQEWRQGGRAVEKKGQETAYGFLK